MYAALLEAALGQDVDVYLPVAQPEPQHDPAFSGEFTIEPLLPSGWRRHNLPASPGEYLEALRPAIQAHSRGTLFVVAPWLSFRELPDSVRESHGRLGFHEIALLTAAERACPGVCLGSLIPYATVAGEASRGFRGEFFTRTHPDLVIAHEGLASELGLSSSFATSIVLATRSRTEGVTRFFRVPRGASEDHVVPDLRTLLARDGGTTTYGFVLRQPPPPGSSLSHDLRSPELTAAKLSLEHLGELRPVTEIFEILAGLNVAQEQHLVSILDPGVELPLLIEGRAVQRGSIAIDSVARQVRADETRLLRPGDILIRAIASATDDRLTVAEVPDGFPAASAASTVLVLRPRDGISFEQRRVAVQYLSSRLAMQVVRAMSAGGHQVAEPLRRIVVPVPDDDLDVAIRDLRDAADQFRRWALEADAASSDLFERVSPEEWRAQILGAGHRVRERERAASQVEELGFRVRTLFPHPLAYAWRVVEASRSDYDGYKAVLETAETLLAYVAVLAFIGARAIEEPVPYVTDLAARVSGPSGRGVNMGDWYSILVQIRDGRATRARVAETPFPEIFGVWTTEGAKDSLNRLKLRRDDDSHGRRPEAADLESAYDQARLDLTALFEAADFLVEYPLRLIEETRWRVVDQSTEYEFRDLRGDHPLVPLKRAFASTHELESGSLYITTRRDELHRISPILVRASCPECKATATFCFDKFDRSTQTPTYRALEHRHTAERPDLTDDLRSTGLLTKDV